MWFVPLSICLAWPLLSLSLFLSLFLLSSRSQWTNTKKETSSSFFCFNRTIFDVNNKNEHTKKRNAATLWRRTATDWLFTLLCISHRRIDCPQLAVHSFLFLFSFVLEMERIKSVYHISGACSQYAQSPPILPPWADSKNRDQVVHLFFVSHKISLMFFCAWKRHWTVVHWRWYGVIIMLYICRHRPRVLLYITFLHLSSLYFRYLEGLEHQPWSHWSPRFRAISNNSIVP